MKAQTARKIRVWHQYIALFFMPAILFFSLSGALQTLGLHENHGDAPPAPGWIRWMASIHKNQNVLLPSRSDHEKARPSRATPIPELRRNGDEHRAPLPSPIPLKIFVVFLAAGLILSSSLGATIALTNRAARRGSLTAVALGVIVPIILGVL